jgi:hypothetical protein
MLGSTTFVVIMLVAVAWILVATVILAACRMAARSDTEIASPVQRPLRPATWKTVRSKILWSPQGDRLATYK